MEGKMTFDPTASKAVWMAALWLAALAGCGDKTSDAAAVAKAPAGTTQAAPAQAHKPLAGPRVPLAKILTGVEQEIVAMENILQQRSKAASALGRMNGAFQRRGYFRRVPSRPALDGLRADLGRLARSMDVRLARIDATPDKPRPIDQTLHQPGVRWEPALKDLRGVVHLTMDLAGAPDRVAGFINRLPHTVERMVLIISEETIPGGIRLYGEAYYEHPHEPPGVDLRWPGLQERLLAAGWEPGDPALTKDPTMARLKKAVARGRAMAPDARAALKVVSDFPRWLLREAFFEERSMRVASVRGEILLGTTLPGQ